MRRRTFLQTVAAVPLALRLFAAGSTPAQRLRLATFDIDATPPVGSRLTPEVEGVLMGAIPRLLRD